jgi:predicted permease
MSTARRFVLRLLSFFRSGHGDADLRREIRAHLQLLEDQFIGQGMTPDNAVDAARRAFGGVDQVRAHQRDTRSFRWLDDSWLDFKLGARMLIKYPGLSLVGGIAMAVAIAFGAAAFAFFYSYLYPTLPLDEGERVIALENWDVAANNEERQSVHDLVTWQAELRLVQDVAAFRTISRNLIVPGGAVEPIRIAEMTASGFSVSRVPPFLGRPLVEDDQRLGAAPVLVIGYDVWQTRFGSDPAVVGREVRLGNTLHTIVGVMPERFAFPVNHSYWAPLRVNPSDYPRGQGPQIFIFGRLAPGVTAEEAQAELSALGWRASAAFPSTHAQLRPRVLPYTYPLADIQDVSLWEVAMMQLMISMLLIIVAFNVAILIYARTATRQAEIAVRNALGASRPRIVGQLFIEALVLAATAAAVGLGLAKVVLQQGHLIMEAEGIRSPFWMDYALPGPVVIYVLALTVVAAVIAGVVPAVKATGRGVQSTLKQLGGSTGLQLGRTWTVLIIAQVAFAVGGLPVAAAMGWNEIRHATTTPEFAAEQFLAAAFAMDPEPPAGGDLAVYRRELPIRFEKLQSELISRLEDEPWVADVTLARSMPGQEPTAYIEIDGLANAGTRTANGNSVSVNHVEIDFFDAFEASILTGRPFHAGERDTAAKTVIVNRTFVRQVLNDADALGRRIRYVSNDDAHTENTQAERWFEIVGIVADLDANALDPELATAAIYHPRVAREAAPLTLAARVRGGTPSSFVGRLREITTAIDPTLRLNPFPLVEIYRQQNVALRLVGLVVGLIIVSVLMLSAAGIYALMSFTVAQRKKEIGIRAALGAEPQRLLRSIFGRAAGQLTVGLVVGVLSIALLDLLSEGSLMGGQQAIILPVISVLMLAAGLIAAVGPARRGLRMDPTQALREP